MAGFMMKLSVCKLVLLCTGLAVNSLAAGKVDAGSKIYVDAQDGFDTYLTAALQKKHVPVMVVENKENADYVLSGVSDHLKPGWAKTLALGQVHSDDQASVKLVNIKSGEVVFAYAVNKKNTLHGRQTVAEACAKHLKEAMEGKE